MIRSYMMNMFLNVIAVFLLPQIHSVASSSCPDFCRCVEMGGPVAVNHVRCRGVADLLNCSFPEHVVFLDLARTSLRAIPPFHFKKRGLVEIVELDLSGNNLAHVFPGMFEGLNNLKILNLGYNRIQYFDPRSLIYNNLLTHLVLRGAHLPEFAGPLVISRSLEFLDISACGIENLPELALTGLPHLKILNISENPLRVINPSADFMKQLKLLDFSRTNVSCDFVEMAGLPCPSSHSDRKTRSISESTSIQEEDLLGTPVTTEELPGEGSVVVTTADAPVASIDYEPEAESELPEETTLSITESPNIPTICSSDFTFTPHSDLVPSWIGWTAFGGGLALGALLTTGLGYAGYVRFKQPEDPNELVSAGDDFQLVPRPFSHPNLRNGRFSMSNFSTNNKVLPTVQEVWFNPDAFSYQ